MPERSGCAMRRTCVISVSGSRAGAGKTGLLQRLIPFLGHCAAVKARVQQGAPLSVVAEHDARTSRHKDTGRYLSAGARRAFLITGNPSDVLRAVKDIVASGEFDVVAVESNALVADLGSDLSFFVRAEGQLKQSAQACERLADVVVCRVSLGKKGTPCRANRRPGCARH